MLPLAARTAAMFAHRLRHWKSYSIDPAMEYRSSEVRLLEYCSALEVMNACVASYAH